MLGEGEHMQAPLFQQTKHPILNSPSLSSKTHSISQSSYSLTQPHSRYLDSSQQGYFTTSIKKGGNTFKSLYWNRVLYGRVAAEIQQYRWARIRSFTLLEAYIILPARVTQTISNIISIHKHCKGHSLRLTWIRPNYLENSFACSWDQ